MYELATLAKYPFLQETKQYIRNRGPTVEELLTNMLYERARTIGIERLENAIKKRDVENRSLATETDAIMELLSYPIARMITVCVDDSYFKRRYAHAEAHHTYLNLLNEPTTFLLKIAMEFKLDVQQFKHKPQLQLFFKDYLRNAPTRYKEWKMVNRTIDQGYITISHKELARILLETLRTRINDELDSHTCNQLIYQTFKSDIQRFQNQAAQQKRKYATAPVGKLSIEKLPPCMKDILAAIKAGENVPHMGRFALVAFLNSQKLKTNDILKLFSTAPDYEEDKTRYQVEHITGNTSTTAYKSPGCDKMRTYGICPNDKIDDLCRQIHHPLSYYSKKWKEEKKTT